MQVRTRKEAEKDVSEEECAELEKACFDLSYYKNPAPCKLGKASLIELLEELQWQGAVEEVPVVLEKVRCLVECKHLTDYIGLPASLPEPGLRPLGACL